MLLLPDVSVCLQQQLTCTRRALYIYLLPLSRSATYCCFKKIKENTTKPRGNRDLVLIKTLVIFIYFRCVHYTLSLVFICCLFVYCLPQPSIGSSFGSDDDCSSFSSPSLPSDSVSCGSALIACLHVCPPGFSAALSRAKCIVILLSI